mmetsp:Transcript_153554/g.490932  ORF Transcript_153554/g.490932 Transcript_153554/m.490932 type:complete len:251 (+) Transcript_153554:6983-7735(+)
MHPLLLAQHIDLEGLGELPANCRRVAQHPHALPRRELGAPFVGVGEREEVADGGELGQQHRGLNNAFAREFRRLWECRAFAARPEPARRSEDRHLQVRGPAHRTAQHRRVFATAGVAQQKRRQLLHQCLAQLLSPALFAARVVARLEDGQAWRNEAWWQRNSAELLQSALRKQLHGQHRDVSGLCAAPPHRRRRQKVVHIPGRTLRGCGFGRHRWLPGPVLAKVRRAGAQGGRVHRRRGWLSRCLCLSGR